MKQYTVRISTNISHVKLGRESKTCSYDSRRMAWAFTRLSTLGRLPIPQIK